jgi:hypothetical protein
MKEKIKKISNIKNGRISLETKIKIKQNELFSNHIMGDAGEW